MFLKLDFALVLPLALLVARIAGTDDADRPVAFDDLAEFASALHRSSYFHNYLILQWFGLFETVQNIKNPSRALRPLTRWRPKARTGGAGQTKLEYFRSSRFGAASGGICDTGKIPESNQNCFIKYHRCGDLSSAISSDFAFFCPCVEKNDLLRYIIAY